MGELLKNPPLIEAVCEFHFEDDSKWDWTVPGRLFDKIGAEFSERAEVHRLGVTIQQASGKVSAPSVIEAGPDRIQLKRSDGSAMVQVGARQLVINQLQPYQDWKTFCELILRIYATYNDVVGGGTLSRIGLRYINQIGLSGQACNEVITIWPSLANSLNKNISSFYQRYELIHDNPDGLLIHQTGLIGEENKKIVVLDLDFISNAVSSLTSRDSISDWLNRAHDRVEEAFIDSLTPTVYARFKEGVL